MTRVDNKVLHTWGFSTQETLRSYQLEGVNWMKGCYDSKHGALLCDEMGLGKTCQAISFILLVKQKSDNTTLVLCPLSVLKNWKLEMDRFAPHMKSIIYIGDQDQRSEIRRSIRRTSPDVILTSYDMCLRDSDFFERLKLDALIVDEGHRLKNSESFLYKCLQDFDVGTRLLLTGTPIQNNLEEMYSLLSFVAPNQFNLRDKDQFVEKYKNIKSDGKLAEQLQAVIKPYILRRTKNQVALDIPDKSEVTIYHPISELQKKYYKAILTKDAEAFESENSVSRTRLLHLLQQLRKCVNHPYLFDGVEPEPFQLGEHLIEASAKLVTLDLILAHVKAEGHKVLLFCQMTRMLDILQDYLHYRGYTYERLDGSVRDEERFTAIQNFNSTSDTFVFLLSSRAGGQGLNLTAADTVIFYDHDFNPQVDLQAAARAHRIGQTRPVKIIRLVGKSTVEEYILGRAQAKLRLTQAVMSNKDDEEEDDLKKQSVKDLQKLLKSGLSSLLTASSDQQLNIEEIIGSSADNKWVVDSQSQTITDSQKSSNSATSEAPENMYQFEGKDYSKEATVSKQDEQAFNDLVIAAQDDQSEEGTRLSKRVGGSSATSLVLPERTRKPLTAEQLEARRKQREKTLELKKKQAEELERKRQERKFAKWDKAGYISVSLPDYDDDDETEATSDDEDDDKDYLRFVTGDVTGPTSDHCIVVQCVDNSGQWGSGGVFTAISNKTKQVEIQYELAGDMKDLHIGDTHLITCTDVSGYKDYSVALLVAQNRDLTVKQTALTTCLQKLLAECKKRADVTVHLPRLGYNTPAFDWYGTERLLRKHLANNKIMTYVYYYKRRQCTRPLSPLDDLEDDAPSGSKRRRASNSSEPMDEDSSNPIKDILTNLSFVLDASVPERERRQLQRYIVAFNGCVQTCIDEDTNYVVTIEPIDCQYGKPIKPEYVFDCISNNTVLPVQSYIVE